MKAHSKLGRAACLVVLLNSAFILNSAIVSSADVDARKELRKVQEAYQQYLADERDYQERTRDHLAKVVQQVTEQVLFSVAKEAAIAKQGENFGKDFDAISKRLYNSYKFGKAATADDMGGATNILIKQSLDDLVAYLQESNFMERVLKQAGPMSAEAAVAYKLGKLGVDGVFDFLYLWQDQKQREELDKRREALDKLREYWTKYDQTHKWEKPLDDSDSSKQSNKDAIKKLLAQIGVEVMMPSEAVRQGAVEISAKTASGFSLTNVKLVSKRATWTALNMAGASFIPANGDSGSQRIGLVSVAIKRSAQALPGTLPSYPTFNSRASRSLMSGNGFLSKASYFATTSVPARDFPAYSDKYWVLLAPGASVEIPFNSVCLDQGRGTPKSGEGFYVAAQPLPARVQRVLMTAALHKEVPQDKVWKTISTEGIRWHDPRAMPSLLSNIRSGLETGQFISAFNECRELLSYSPDSPEAILLMAYAYYGLALSGEAADTTGTYNESYNYFSRALDLKQEVTLPVKHHISLGLDQKLSSGFLTLAKGTLKYRSSDEQGRDFVVPISSVYELRLETDEVQVTYNFHPSFAGTNRQFLYFSPTAQFSYNALSCPDGCYLAMEVFFHLMQREMSK
jgi:hypothetical protein